MCNCLRVSKNTYYSWLRKKDFTGLPKAKESLRAHIKELFQQSREIYGSRRIQKEFERLPVFGNRLDLDFHCGELGKKGVSDITCIRMGRQWNYLTTIIGLADRKVVGWSLSEDMTTDSTVVRAWSMTRRSRNILEGFLFHSDRGSQYASIRMTDILGLNAKIGQPMSRKANCWDNAVAENFFKTIKYEWIYRFDYRSFSEARSSIYDYITWYSTKRLHSSLGYRSPLEMELYIRGLNKKAARN